MFSTITKLIWVVFLLPCIQAQSNEFIFTETSGSNIFINVTADKEIKLTCISSGVTLPTFIRLDLISNTYIDVVSNDIVNKRVKERYNYTFDENGINVLTIKYIDRHSIEQYYCVTDRVFLYNLVVFYSPGPPICTSMQVNETITLLCESELSKPTTSMVISDSITTYTPTLIESNDTHTSQMLDYYGYGGNVKCTTTYNFIQKGMVYTTIQSCMFDDIVDTDITTIDNLLTANSYDNSSDIPKYNIVALIVIMLLSRTI